MRGKNLVRKSEFLAAIFKCPAGHICTNTAAHVSVSRGCGGHPEGERCYCPDDERAMGFNCYVCHKAGIWWEVDIP